MHIKVCKKKIIIIDHSLNTIEGPPAGLCHAVHEEGGQHLHDFQHQRGHKVVGGGVL
jgi:hypothetical protein